MAAPNLCTVLSTTKHIIKSDSRPFRYLSLFFLLPLSILALISPALSLANPYINFILLPPSLVLTLLATGTISYNTSEAFLGRHVTISGSLKSLSRSFFPLLSTALVVQLLLFLVFFAFGLVFFLLTLGFGTSYQSNRYFWAILCVIFTLFFGIIIHFQVNWSLAFAIAVVESKWGFEPLRRSKYLIKGMRSTALSLLLLFGVLIGFTSWFYSNPNIISFDDMSHFFNSSIVILAESYVLALYSLFNIASNTVLYMYCKAEHGELSLEIAEEFVGDYVSIPIDDAKPHEVAYAEPDSENTKTEPV